MTYTQVLQKLFFIPHLPPPPLSLPFPLLILSPFLTDTTHVQVFHTPYALHIPTLFKTLEHASKKWSTIDWSQNIQKLINKLQRHSQCTVSCLASIHTVSGRLTGVHDLLLLYYSFQQHYTHFP